MLIQCPECEKEISSYAVTCPHCGFPTEKHKALLECPRCGEKERNALTVKYKTFPNFIYQCARCGALLNYQGKEGWVLAE